MKLHALKREVIEPVIGPVDKAVLIEGAPETRVWVTYDAPDERLCTGEWEATQGTWRVNYEEWEYCLVVSGRCVVTGDDGSVVKAGPGDSFVIEPGFTGTWQVIEPMRKHWVIRTPA